jgi:hypothetical protein
MPHFSPKNAEKLTFNFKLAGFPGVLPSIGSTRLPVTEFEESAWIFSPIFLNAYE